METETPTDSFRPICADKYVSSSGKFLSDSCFPHKHSPTIRMDIDPGCRLRDSPISAAVASVEAPGPGGSIQRPMPVYGHIMTADQPHQMAMLCDDTTSAVPAASSSGPESMDDSCCPREYCFCQQCSEADPIAADPVALCDRLYQKLSSSTSVAPVTSSHTVPPTETTTNLLTIASQKLLELVSVSSSAGTESTEDEALTPATVATTATNCTTPSNSGRGGDQRPSSILSLASSNGVSAVAMYSHHGHHHHHHHHQQMHTQYRHPCAAHHHCVDSTVPLTEILPTTAVAAAAAVANNNNTVYFSAKIGAIAAPEPESSCDPPATIVRSATTPVVFLCRPQESRVLLRLSVSLIRTYQAINEMYYSKKRRHALDHVSSSDDSWHRDCKRPPPSQQHQQHHHGDSCTQSCCSVALPEEPTRCACRHRQKKHHSRHCSSQLHDYGYLPPAPEARETSKDAVVRDNVSKRKHHHHHQQHRHSLSSHNHHHYEKIHSIPAAHIHKQQLQLGHHKHSKDSQADRISSMELSVPRCSQCTSGSSSAKEHLVKPGEIWMNRYSMDLLIGTGSFGQVVRANDLMTGEPVAIKIIRNRRSFVQQAETEIRLLRVLARYQEEQEALSSRHWGANCIVRLKSHFMYRGHLCLVFELLTYSLYELLRNTGFSGVSLNLTRKFGLQLCSALHLLSQPALRIVHCDLKPENVLLVHPRRSAIKLVDFGSSCRLNERLYVYIQSRFYRAPEVLLYLPYSLAIDMWSLGCVLVELHTGQPLFVGQNEHEQMLRIIEVVGMPPDHMIHNSKRANKYFMESDSLHNSDTVPDSSHVHYEPKVFRNRDGKRIPFEGIAARKLASLLGAESGGPDGRRKDEQGHSPSDYACFLDLVRRMLTIDPSTRITPDEALKHPFFAGGNSLQELSAEESAMVSATPVGDTGASKVDGASTSSIGNSPV